MAESADHITCQEVVEVVSDYLEGALEPNELELLEQHVNFCEGCEWYVDQLRRTIATVGQMREEELPPESRERLLAAFREWSPS
jgi:predicted anti-sigma-YlaC factor YlaD